MKDLDACHLGPSQKTQASMNINNENLSVIESIRAVYKLNNGKEMSFERASDLLKVTNILVDEIFNNGFICSKCGEVQHFYQIRQ